MKARLLLAIGSACMLVGCGSDGGSLKASAEVPFERLSLKSSGTGQISILAEVADTPERREKGLKGRKEVLWDNRGMLFVFDDEQPRSFWMKDTLIPLDILYFRADGSFISAASMAPCKEEPCPLYASAEPAALALELPEGFVAKHAVTDGWKIVMK